MHRFSRIGFFSGQLSKISLCVLEFLSLQYFIFRSVFMVKIAVVILFVVCHSK